MSGFVVDASFVMMLCLKEGTQRQMDTAQDLLQSEDTAVPSVWAAEVRNALIANERRGRISPREVEEWFGILEGSPTTTDFNRDHLATLALARTHDLTFYDALYLELALRRQAALASLDDALIRAAGVEGVPALSV